MQSISKSCWLHLKIYTESDSLLPSYLLPVWSTPPSFVAFHYGNSLLTNWSPLFTFTLLPSLLSFVATVILLKHKPDHIPPPVASHLIQSRSQSHHNGLPDPAWTAPPSLTFLCKFLFLPLLPLLQPHWVLCCSSVRQNTFYSRTYVLNVPFVWKTLPGYLCGSLTISFMSLLKCHLLGEISVIIYKISTLTPTPKPSVLSTLCSLFLITM